MKTRILVLTLILIATQACAQIAKWDTVRYDKWGFELQIPTGSAKQAVENQPAGETCDLYSVGGLVCVVKVTPTPDTELSSTVIERAIQAEVKAASALGPAKRWEQDSKQGDLFKGFTAPIKIGTGDPIQAAIGKIVGESEAFESISMVPLGDDTSPVLRVTVIGPRSRQAEVANTAKGVVAFMTRTQVAKSEPVVVVAKKVVPEPRTRAVSAPKPAPVRVAALADQLIPEPKHGVKYAPTPKKLIVEPRPEFKPAPRLKPAPLAQPWPMLKKGEIELVGTVTSVSPDGRIMMLCVNSIMMPGQAPIILTPTRSKNVMLRNKPGWLAVGQCIRVIGKNTGVGKPMTADAVGQASAQ